MTPPNRTEVGPDSPPPADTRSIADPAAAGGDPTAEGPRDTAGASLPPTLIRPWPTSAGRYVLTDEIARGGMGAVYRATDTALGREVAVKVLRDRYDPDSGVARRFADEARIAAQLQHPAIPPVHDLGTLPDGRRFLAMKLIKGETLDRLLRGRTGPSADRGRFVAVFEQVCQALAYAHAHKVIHRDLKPANVMVGAFGEVQVMDWGLAKVLPASGRVDPGRPDPDETRGGTEVVSLRESDGSDTQAGSVLGTPAFMPPEQAVGAVNKIDAHSDVFGLVAILAVILTGEPPFAGSSAETTRVKAAQGDVAECLARLDGCEAEPGLATLCRRCLSARPADRPADAGEVARAVAGLRAAAEERAHLAELDQAKAEVRAAEQRKKRRALLAAAGALAHFREALELREEMYREAVETNTLDVVTRSTLMLTLARCGEHARVVKLAEEVRAPADPRVPAEEVGTTYGLCMAVVENGRPLDRLTPEERAVRDRYHDLAVAAVKEGAARGYLNFLFLEGDPDMDPLLALPEFRQWQADVKKSSTAK
jgi:hypothetical protein